MTRSSLPDWPTAVYVTRTTNAQSTNRPLVCLLPGGVFQHTDGRVNGQPIVMVIPSVDTFRCIDHQWTNLLGHWRDGWVVVAIEDLDNNGLPVATTVGVEGGGGVRVWRFIVVYGTRFCTWINDPNYQEEEATMQRCVTLYSDPHATARLAVLQGLRTALRQSFWPTPVELRLYYMNTKTLPPLLHGIEQVFNWYLRKVNKALGACPFVPSLSLPL